MTTATLNISDEVNLQIVGVHRHHLEELSLQMAEFVPGYKYMPQFTMGTWDGKTRFSTVGGRSFQVFIPEIVQFLKARGYGIKLADNRPLAPFEVSEVDDQLFSEHNWILRPHQVEAINAIITNDHRGVILACTGSGKTTIVCGLSKVYGDIGFRSIVIVPNRDLIRQTIDQYEKLGLDVGEFSGKVKDLDHTHIISTWQALKNLPSVLQMFQVIMIDECLAADTNITMADGSTKPIVDVKPGDEVLSYNTVEQRFESDTVVKQHVNLIKSSGEKMYQLTFDGGQTVEVTGNHKFLTQHGFVRADCLTEEHDVVALGDVDGGYSE